MKKGTMIWLIVAAALVLAGAVLFMLALQMARFDFSAFDRTKYETNTHTVIEEFGSISIDTDTADVKLLPSEDGSVCVETVDEEKLYHVVEVKDGVLNVRLEDVRKWYEHIRLFDFGKEEVTVYLPKGEYETLTVSLSTGDVEIPAEFSFEKVHITGSTGDVSCGATVEDTLSVKLTTGAVKIENTSVGSMALTTSTGVIKVSSVACEGDAYLTVSTGKTTLEGVTCRSLISRGDTGKITLKEVVATDRFTIERDTGDVIFDRCDAGEIDVTTSTGDVRGTLLSDKIFFAETDTGRVNVPKSIKGGRCEVTTSTGDIQFQIVAE